MTGQQLVALGIRLFAVWLAIGSIRYLSSVPLYVASTGDIAEKVYQAYVIAGAYLTAALLLWFFPAFVARNIIPRTRFNDTVHANARTLARVGCIVLGLWLLSKSLPGIVGSLFFLLIQGISIREVESYAQVDFVVYVFELALSFFLIFKAHTFVRLGLATEKES